MLEELLLTNSMIEINYYRELYAVLKYQFLYQIIYKLIYYIFQKHRYSKMSNKNLRVYRIQFFT